MNTDKDPFDPLKHGWEVMDGTGFAGLLGPIWRKSEDGATLYGLPTTESHLNPNGRIHGGTVLGFIDHFLGRTARDAGINEKKVTVQLDTQFIGAPHAGEFLIGRGTVVRRTRSLIFMRGEVTVGSTLISTATGIWKLLGT